MLKKVFEFIKKNILIISVIFIAVVLRLYSLGGMPPSLNWDEVSHGYNAYSVLKTGRDEWGVLFPTIFRAYGDYKLPVYIYLTAISEFFLGLNAFAVRLPSVLAGIGTVIFTYPLVEELFKDRKVSLVSAFLVAAEPWSLFLSRGAFEANLALFFIVSGAYYFLKGSQKPKCYLASLFLFGLAVWTYNSARVFVPLLMGVLFLIYRKDIFKASKKNIKFSVYGLLIATFFFLLMFFQLLNPAGQARYGKVSIIDAGAVAQIIEARQNSNLNPLVERFFYNRPVYFIQRFISNWGSHFTCNFLFFQGGNHYQFSIPGQGLLSWVNLPFFFMGLIFLLRGLIKRDKTSLFLLSWLFLAPIPSSLTREAPHVLRSIVMLPVPMIISAMGLVVFAKWSVKFVGKMMRWPTWPSDINIIFSRSKALYLTYFLVSAILVNNYLLKYFDAYKKDYSWSWQYGYEQIVDFAKQNYDKYDKIVVTKKYGEPHEFFLFYWPWDSKNYRNDPNLIRYSKSDWFWVDAFDKFYFVNDWDIPKEEWQTFVLESGAEFKCEIVPDDLKPFVEYDAERCLLFTSPGNVPKGWSKVGTVNFLNGQTAFEIYEN